MAPIVASGSGIPPQVLDDPALRELLSHLNELPDEVKTLADLEELTVLLDPWKEEWLFEEQVRLFLRLPVLSYFTVRHFVAFLLIIVSLFVAG